MNIFQRLKKYTSYVKRSWIKFRHDYLYLHAAALAFFTVFSLPPILVVIIFTASKLYNPIAVQEYIYLQIGTLIGRDGTEQIADSIERLMVIKPKLWATILGVITLLFISTTVFNSIKNSLNYIFKVPPKSGKTRFIQQIVNRFLSLGVLLGFTGILFLSLIISTYVKISMTAMSNQLGSVANPINGFLSIMLPFLVLSLLFSIIFTLLPDTKIRLKNTLIGGLLTAVLFSIGKYVISYIIVHGQVSGFYDAAGSLMALMLWAYYSSIIFLFGACFTYITMQENTVQS